MIIMDMIIPLEVYTKTKKKSRVNNKPEPGQQKNSKKQKSQKFVLEGVQNSFLLEGLFF